ncbi:MAG: hypothetical protein V4561_00370 [Bacteroidota bacterium]
MKKRIWITLLACSSVISTHAQLYIKTPGGKKPDRVEDLFDTNKDELDLNFQINISKGVMLDFAITRNGLWKGKEEFRKPLIIASQQLKLYADSLKPFANSKRLDIYVGKSEGEVVSRFGSSQKHNNIRIDKSGELEALKMNSDTLRIVKAYEYKRIGGVPMAERFQYTFEMKELKDFSSIIEDEHWVDMAVQMIDSVLGVYRDKWRNPDAEFHSLYVKYNPRDTVLPLFISKRRLADFNRMSGILTLSGGFGVSLVRNTLCPGVNAGIQFHFKGDVEEVPFVKVSMNTIMRFEEQADKKFRGYTTGFLNAEIGIRTNEDAPSNRNFLLSVGFGYKLNTQEQFFQDPSMDKRMYKLFFNYSLSKSIILQPEFITNFKKKEKSNGWIGMTIGFQLF